MNKPMILNIVSGKGGTGKSLLCAVLGRLLGQQAAKVLLVDMDLFVRGLSHFYYRYIQERRKITNAMSVADFFELTGNKRLGLLAKERFFEIDLVPAVAEIEEQIDYLQVADHTLEKAHVLLNKLRSESDYDFVIIDNRAGIDELIIETSREADLTISVSEADPISRSTNENLLRHLNTSGAGKVYTIINKAKSLRTYREYKEAMERVSGDFSVLGQIPFDLDLFESFGTPSFWDIVNSTKYAFAVAESWNKLAKREGAETTIDMKRFSPSLSWTLRRVPMFLNRTDRVSIVMGFTMLFGYFVFDILQTRDFGVKDALLLYSLVMFAFPLLRRFLLLPHSDASDKSHAESN